MKNLLSINSDAKTKKGVAFGYFTAILYLAPWKLANGLKNVCANASKGCIESCLYTAGMGIFSNVQLARINKTLLFFENRIAFLEQIAKEINKLSKKYGATLVVRLNGTSDIPFENIKFDDGLNIFEKFPLIQFYDYTKDITRVIDNNIKNYQLTFSVDEREVSKERAKYALNQGNNIAVVINKKLHSSLFEAANRVELNGKTFVNGDESDLRFLDPVNSIVTLKAKGKANKDKTGFVVNDLNEI